MADKYGAEITMVRTVCDIKFVSDAIPVKDYEWEPVWYEIGPVPNDYDCATQHWKYAIKLNHWAVIITVRN